MESTATTFYVTHEIRCTPLHLALHKIFACLPFIILHVGFDLSEKILPIKFTRIVKNWFMPISLYNILLCLSCYCLVNKMVVSWFLDTLLIIFLLFIRLLPFAVWSSFLATHLQSQIRNFIIWLIHLDLSTCKDRFFISSNSVPKP